MAEFYIYRHIRPDINVPFYIGMGTQYKNTNENYRRAHIITNRSIYWNNVYSLNNQNIEVEIMYESDSYEEILEKEKEFIALYGRADLGLGSLVNHTDGGQRPNSGKEFEFVRHKYATWTGRKHTDDTKKKMSMSAKGHKRTLGIVRSDEFKQKLSKSKKGKKRPKEVVEKMRKSMIGKKWTESQRENFRKARMGYKHSEETKIKISLSQKGKKKNLTLEQKKNISDRNRARIVSEETKKKMSDAHKKRNLK